MRDYGALVCAILMRRSRRSGFVAMQTALPDPEGLLEGAGARLRHVNLRRPEDARRPSVVALLTAARDERRRALNLA